MKTSTGLQLDLLRPQASQIDLQDIAHGLSQMCRFNGQTPVFYSVAEHSVRVAYYMLACHRNADLALAGLFHDAAEAYLPDVHSDLKNHLGVFRNIENRLSEVICEAFGLKWPMDKQYKEADRILLATEGRDLMGWDLREPHFKDFPQPLQEPIVPWSMQEARDAFLQTFRNLMELKSTFIGILTRNVCQGYL